METFAVHSPSSLKAHGMDKSIICTQKLHCCALSVCPQRHIALDGGTCTQKHICCALFTLKLPTVTHCLRWRHMHTEAPMLYSPHSQTSYSKTLPWMEAHAHRVAFAVLSSSQTSFINTLPRTEAHSHRSSIAVRSPSALRGTLP